MASRDTKRLLAALQNAERSVARERRHRLAAAGLNLAQAQILEVLARRDGHPNLNELTAELGVDAPPSRVVSGLVSRGLVQRKDRRGGDRRQIELRLTARGRQKLRQVRRVDQAVSRWATRRLKRLPVKGAEKVLTALAATDR